MGFNQSDEGDTVRSPWGRNIAGTTALCLREARAQRRGAAGVGVQSQSLAVLSFLAKAAKF